MTDTGRANYEGYRAATLSFMPGWDDLTYQAKLGYDAGATSVELWLAEHPAEGGDGEAADAADQSTLQGELTERLQRQVDGLRDLVRDLLTIKRPPGAELAQRLARRARQLDVRDEGGQLFGDTAGDGQ